MGVKTQNAPKEQRRHHSEKPSSKKLSLESPSCDFALWSVHCVLCCELAENVAVHSQVFGQPLPCLPTPPASWHTPQNRCLSAFSLAGGWGIPIGTPKRGGLRRVWFQEIHLVVFAVSRGSHGFLKMQELALL